MASKVLLISIIAFAIDAVISSELQNRSDTRVLSRRKRFVIFPTGSSFSVAVCMTIGVYGNPQFSIFSWALNYGFAYNLPSNASYFLNAPPEVTDFPFFKDETTTTTTVAPETTILPDHEHDHPPDYDHDHPPDHDHDHAPDPPSRRQYYVYTQPKFETKPMMQRRYRRDIYKNIEGVLDRMGYSGRDCILQSLCESSQIFNTKQKTMIQELIKTVFSFPKSKVLPFEHPELMVYDEAHRKGQSQIDCNKIWSCGFSLIQLALGKYHKPQQSFM